MNTRWTLDEEKLLIKSIKSGESLEKLAKELDRSENALELRVKKIIYDNIAENKPISTLSRNLNMSPDKIKQYFYSYKDMMDKKGKTTVDIKEDIHSNNDKKDNDKKDNDNVLSNIQRHVNKETEREMNKEREKHKDKNKEITKIKMQNEKMETILKNIELKTELKKAIKGNKLDKYQLKMFKDVVDK
jgi:hypothetical protein